MSTSVAEGPRRAIRSLLSSPLLGSEDPEALAEIRRHRRAIEQFFGDELGYRLDASRPGLARLAKVPGPGHEARGLRTRSGKLFDARRYALVCLVLAAAETAGERTTAARLFQEVATRAAALESFAFSTEVSSHRRLFVQAVQAGPLLLRGSEEGGFLDRRLRGIGRCERP